MTHETTHETGNEPQHDPGPETSHEAGHDSSHESGNAVDATALSTVEAPAAAGPAENAEETGESFADALRDFERARTRRPAGQQAAAQQLEGTVVSLTADQVILDVGYKMEGVLPRSSFENNAESVKRGDKFPVSIKGRNEEGYYELSRFRVAQPRDWSALEQAFAEKTPIVGTVTAAVKGGLSVDVGVRAFMPASRSGTRDAAELEALVGTEITCRITKLDVADEDVVVDRRVVLEEQSRAQLSERRAALKPGDTVTGTVRTLMPYGAFVTIGTGAGAGSDMYGLDGLLHVSDISRARVAKPEDVLSVGQELTLRVLKVDPETGKIGLGLKQLQPEPWETAAERYVPGARVSGAVTRLTDFGAFVELEPGLEGMIHISEMSWAKKVRHPSDLLKVGDRVDAVILSLKPPAPSDTGRGETGRGEAGRIALGLKQTLADPWVEVQRKFPVGSQVEGPVTKLMNFGAFVEIAEGVEGLVHISEIAAGRRLNHPSEALRAGQRVQALVLAVDAEKRQIKLSMKQLIPTSVDEYIAEHKPGDTVSGRVVAMAVSGIEVELGEGIRGMCRLPRTAAKAQPSAASSGAAPAGAGKADLSSLSSMLQARWKGSAPAPQPEPEALAEGQVRSFRIVKLDAEKKTVEVELA